MAVNGNSRNIKIQQKFHTKRPASNLLNRLESLNFCSYGETKEYYETLRERHLLQRLKF